MSAFCFNCFSGQLAPLLGTSLAVRTLIEYLIMGGAVLLVTGIVLVWALLFRRSRRRRTRIYRRHQHHVPDETSRSGAGARGKTVETPDARPRRHHRSRRHRPRNPTLAETGGLPPVRGPQPPPTEFPY